MSRKTISLEIPTEQEALFSQIQKMMGHEEPEETFGLLLRLGEAAISISKREHPEVKMYSRNQSPHGRETSCPSCSHRFIPVFTEDGYKEIAIHLG